MALVIALMTLLVLSATTAAVMTGTAVNHRNSLKSADAKKAFGYAELGLAYAEGKIYSAAASHVTPPHGTQAGPTESDGTITYSTSVAADGTTWTMTGTGVVDGVTRTVSARASVPSPQTVQDTGVWNYLYADKVATDGSCPTTISGSTIVSVPTFVRGNLCLSSAFTGAQLEVGGNLTVSGGQGAVGTATKKIQTLAVTGTCNGVAAGAGICNGSTNPIYATTAKKTLDVTPALPTLDLVTYYNNSNPGPKHPCGTGSTGVPTNFFDNDTSLNNSNASVNLFPSSSYDCKSSSGSEIKWTFSTKTLYVHTASTCAVACAFYFDGSWSQNGNYHVVYSGQSSLYFTGTIATGGTFQICGIANCTASWAPDTNGLILAAACWANSTGSLLVYHTTGGTYCVSYAGTNVIQVGTYCATDFYISGNSTNWGPVLAQTLALNGNMSQLIPFHTMPPGTPENTVTVYLPATAPTGWSG